MLRQRAAVLMVDFTAAFDKVNHRILLQRLRALGVESSERRWIRNFLTDRTATARVNDCCDHPFRQRRGVRRAPFLARSCSSSTSMPSCASSEKRTYDAWMYADDLTLVTTGPVTTCRDELQRACDIISTWCAENDMTVSDKTRHHFYFLDATGPSTSILDAGSPCRTSDRGWGPP
eukprot:PhM_4_TR2092/c0_g4_i1/m.29381